MSVPPDQFDDGEPPDDFDEEFDQEYVAWRADSDPPSWFYDAGDILGDLDRLTAVNLNLDPYESNFQNNSVVLHGYDEDTGEEIFWEPRDWTKEEWIEFYDYIMDYYPEAFWSENYTPHML